MRKLDFCLSMDAIDKAFSELVSIIKSWIPWQSEPANVSRDFWMPDHSCRVCYECDAQFSLFNRRHHCRLCGRIFCSKCTTNSVPAPFSGSQRNSWDEWEKIRVCNYCYKQWEQGIVSFDNSGQTSNLERTMSASSVASSKTSATANSSNITICSMPYSVGSYKQKQQGSFVNNLHQSPKRGKETDREGLSSIGARNIDLVQDLGDPLTKQYGFSMSRYCTTSLTFVDCEN